MYRYATMLCLMLMSATAAPLAQADNVTTYGVGLSSCHIYLQARDRDAPVAVTFIDWLSGYFSAVNRTSRHRNNVLGLGDLKVALGHLDNLCRSHPDLHFAAAAEMVVLGAKPGPATHAIGVTTYGSADKACHLFVDAREQQQPQYWGEYLHWLGGYLSGVNAMSFRTNDVLGARELGDALHWLDGYCSAHPVISFGSAVDALIAAAGDARTG